MGISEIQLKRHWDPLFLATHWSHLVFLPEHQFFGDFNSHHFPSVSLILCACLFNLGDNTLPNGFLLFLVVSVCLFETDSHCVDQADPKLIETHLPLPTEYWIKGFYYHALLEW